MNSDADPDAVLDKINEAKKTVHGRLALADDVLPLLAQAWEGGRLAGNQPVRQPNPYRSTNA